MSKLRLGIIFGGRSTEHEVSRVSAYHVIKAADKEKYDIVMIGITKEGRWLLYDGPAEALQDGRWEAKAAADLKNDPDTYGFCVLGNSGRELSDMIDFALPILHGINGEDGSVQGLLQLSGIPYGGCGITASAVCMDKTTAKMVFSTAMLDQTPYVAFLAGDIDSELIEVINSALEYPLFVKPVNMGSSVGISKVNKPEELIPALEKAAEFDSRLLVEQGVDCREIEVAVMGNDDPVAYQAGEIVTGGEFYDYDDKYKNGVSHPVIPAEIGEEKLEEVKRLAEVAYKACGCEGFARVDFMLDRKTGDLLINEINTIPGFTPISMFPMLMQSGGVSYPEIIDKIVELGMQRAEQKKKI